MILVAVFGKTGFFDYVALKVRRNFVANECFNEDFHCLINFCRALISFIKSFNVLQPVRPGMLFFKTKFIVVCLCKSVFPRSDVCAWRWIRIAQGKFGHLRDITSFLGMSRNASPKELRDIPKDGFEGD